MSPGREQVTSYLAVAIRRMSPSDVSHVMAILNESREAAAWSEKSLVESMSSGMAWIAEQDGVVDGFLVGRCAADEFEILNLAVASAHRRRGIAGRLVNEALLSSINSGARRAYLEVRASNEAAISLYSRRGFNASGRRRAYYKRPVEDAILFSLHLNEIP